MSAPVPSTPQRTPATELQDQQISIQTRHIILPFDLCNRVGDVFDDDKRHVMTSIFPGTTGVGSDGFFVILYLHTLPPTPWPLIIGGAPLHLILDRDPNYPDQPVPPLSPIPQMRLVSSKNGSIASDQNGRDMTDWEPLFHIIKSHFQGLEVSITEVIYWKHFVTVVLKDRDADMTKIPFRAAKIVCMYLFDDEMGRPSVPQARCLTPDHSAYATLQPGLRLSCHQRSELVHLDSPDTGLIDGLSMASSFLAIPSDDDNTPELHWVSSTWIYMGQDSATNLREETCGSAIWNEEGDVLGFFRYAPKDGVMKNWCSGIAADELIKDTRTRQ